ncbi:MAG: anthranilate synthase component I family protein, partial [Burkholderiales bacterium]
LNRSARSYVEKKEPFEVVNKSSTINSLPKQSDKENYRLLVKQIEAKVNTSELYEKYCGSRSNAVWLDSNLVAKDKPALSIIGCMDGPLSYIVKYDLPNKQLEITQGKEVKYIQGNIFDFLKQEIAHYSLGKVDLPFDFHCGFVGYFGYELKPDTISVTNRHKFNHTDAQFIFLDLVIVYDHVKNTCYLLALCNDSVEKQAKCWLEETQELVISCNSVSTEITRPFKSNLPEYELEKNNDKYLTDIDKCLKYIRDGDSYEVCLTNRLIIKDHIDPLKYYLVLRQINPAPYAAFLNFDDIAIASSSMERFLRIDDKGCVETKPIKGTLPRGKDENEDQQIIASLKDEVKFKSENLMIVDLLRNDLGVVCEIGSVHVPKLMDVETYETVHQLVTTVRGQLKHNFSAIDCIKACFPGGSMTGAPKLRTLEIIDEIEESPRGVYSGSIGYLSLNGSVDLNIVIRSAQITPDELCI